MIKNTVGRPVSGGNFFDREAEQRAIWRHLDSDNLLLLAPRRVGKTSLMRRLADLSERHGFQAAYLSVSDVRSELAFIEKLYRAVASMEVAGRVLQRVSQSPVGKLLKRVKKVELLGATVEFEDDAEGQWADLGRALANALAEHDARWLLMVDELPVFVMSLVREDASGVRARDFLNWFREVRQSQMDEADNVRWLLAGSIGLDTVAARLGLGDTINDLRLVQLGAFSNDAADTFLSALATSYGFTLPKPVRQKIVSRLGWAIPYYLQLVFAELRSQWAETGENPGVDEVERAFETLLSPAKKAYFDYWRQRLREELGRPECDFALDVLGAAAESPGGVTKDVLLQVLSGQVADVDDRAELLRYLLDTLESDGYLVAEAGRYRFRSALLREFWVRRVIS